MDRYDPNEWTTRFVKQEPDFCVELLRNVNETVIQMVRSGNYPAAVSGLDRILNGLVTIHNAGFNTRPHICMFSWMEAEIIAFLVDAPEANRRNTAIELYKDAYDYAASESTKEDIADVLSDLRSGRSLSAMRRERGPGFAEDVAQMLENLQSNLVP